MKKKIILIGLTVIMMFSFMINSNVSAKETTVTIDDKTVGFSDEEYIERTVDDGDKLIIAETKELSADTNVPKQSRSLFRSGTTYDEVWLQNEIDNAVADGTVELLGDVVLSAEVILPDKNITINGNDYTISLEEDYHGKHFNANSKHGIHTFKNVTLLGHNTDNPGTMNNGRITGGGIIAGGSKLNTIVFDNCTVKGIHSTTSGAVVKLDNSPFIVKNNTVITQNSSDSNGGVLDMNNGHIEIYDSSMSYNSSYGGAGGIGHIPYGDGAAVYDSEFSYNYAAHEGGAFGAVWSGSKITVEGCTFTGNTTAGNGGAIALNGTMVFTDNDFIENVADGQGGAVYQWGTAVYTNGSFVRNSAKSTGGAIHIVNNNYNKLSADGVTFSENRAARDGISWDVSNPKSAPAMGYDQHTLAEHYVAYIVNIDTFSSAIAENVTYTNIYNNHDVNYDISMAVCFFNDGGTAYKIISHYNNDSLKPPVGFTDVEGKVFLGWRVNSNEANNKGWIPEDWDTSEAYMWDEETMKLTGSVILMGVWADAYDVTYHLNDGSNETAIFSYEQNTEINILSLADVNKDWEVPEGQELVGWALTETEVEGEQLYYPEDLYELNASVDLYARYRSIDLSIIDDFKDDDGIVVIYRTGATGEVSGSYPLGYASTYNLQLQLGNKDISDEQLEEVTWEVESAGGFSNTATYLSIEDGSDEVIAKKSGIVKLTATYKSSSASIYVVIPGDVNRDGLLAAQDATIIQRYYASGSMDDFTINDEFTLLLADMNGDGFISGQDATIIQRMRASVISPSN